MTPAQILATSRVYLDDATENLTFHELTWAAEEAWRGVAWALHALQGTTPTNLGPKGSIPPQGSLLSLLPSSSLTSVDVVQTLEGLHPAILANTATHADIERCVFDAWTLHDACARRLGLFDPTIDGIATPITLQRRRALQLLLAGTGTMFAACDTPTPASPRAAAPRPQRKASTPPTPIHNISSLNQMQWPTSDPFLFCAHHRDDYPAGDANFAPRASLAGRHLGRDFEGKDNWRMYHGRTVPGFPRHPHRGFETVTVVRTGMLDHADSMGAAARYGGGDVQWLTAGGGIQHAEMFPLLRSDEPNPLELFQIWLNLPQAKKMVPPHFSMLWNERIPRIQHKDARGLSTQLTLIAGAYKEHKTLAPPPNSWASDPTSDLAIWTLRMDPEATFTLPQVRGGTHRSLYLFRGEGATISGQSLQNLQRAEFHQSGDITITAGPKEVELLLLQGRPIGEPVARRGPFVMNTQAEIRQAYTDYRRTQFGGWPWPDNDPVHSGTRGRFARFLDGKEEEPG